MASGLQTETRVAIVFEEAQGFGRLRGLIGRAEPEAGHGLLIARCRCVHGCLMAYAIDVAFIDAELRVLRVARLRPWRWLLCRRARHVVELADGECGRLGVAAGTCLEKNLAQGGEFAPLDS